MKRLLITGSNGLLGQKLIAACRNQPDIQLLATSRGENLVGESGHQFEQLDITDWDKTNALIHSFQPHTVINTAAITNVNQGEQEQKACLAINAQAVGNLVEVCNANHTHLVHLSTDFVFDGTAGPYREADIPHPVNYYGHTKHLAEKLVAEKAERWSIVRTILVYGMLPNMVRPNIVTWAKDALEKGIPIKVISDQYRMSTLAEDLADACLSIVRQEATGMFHISGNEMLSILELVHEVADFFQLDTANVTPVTTRELAEPAPRPPRTGFVLEKARRELGYFPTTLRDGLALVAAQMLEYSSKKEGTTKST